MVRQNDSTVFAVVPVFERLSHTLECIAHLKAQTYDNIEIVIVDGGSRDGSVDALRQTEGITLVADIGEQWWAGATWFGVEHALARGQNDDFVMLLNNDTAFGPEMVDVLVSESRRFSAAVAPIALAADGSVVNSGVWIDWPTYTLTQRMDDPGPPFSTWPVDALEGRGTLVPLSMVRVAGNVAHDRLPHYAADYEFSRRLNQRGFPILMTNRTSVVVEWDTDRMSRYWERASLRRLWWEANSRRSFVNIRTHLVLIDLVAPPEVRTRAKAMMIRSRLIWAVRRSKLRDLPGLDTLLAWWRQHCRRP